MRVLDKPVSAGSGIIAADGDRSQDKKRVRSGNVSEKKVEAEARCSRKYEETCGADGHKEGRVGIEGDKRSDSRC